jgi:peptide/nickel transport system substrate-binding protein
MDFLNILVYTFFNMNLRFFILFSIIAGFLSLGGCDGCAEPPPTPHKIAMAKLKKDIRLNEKVFVYKKNPVKIIDKSREINVMVPYLPSHLNPFLRIEEMGYQIAMHNIYEGLLDRDPDTNKLIPCLASSWSVEPGNKIYRFKIRKGVRWQNGRPLSSEDVRFTFELLSIPRIKKGPFISDINFSIVRVDKIGNHEVRVILREPNSYFLNHLPELPILPAHLFYRRVKAKSKISKKPVGTGPYRLHQWISGDSIILVKNEYYWGHSPEIERINFKKIQDPAKAFVAVRRKKIDLLARMSPAHYPDQITKNIQKSYNLYKFVPPTFSYLLWNTKNFILSDFRVRRALSMLIDIKTIIKKVYRGLAEPCNGPFWRPGLLGDKKIKFWQYNPQKAKELLNQVGWQDHDGDKIRDKNGKPMKLIVLFPVGSQRNRQVLEVIKTSYARAGIEMVIVPTNWNLLSRHLRKRKFAAAFLTWKGRAYEDFTPLFHSGGKYNYGVIDNLFVNKLLVKMRYSHNFSNRVTISRQIENMLYSYLPMTYLFRPVYMSVIHKKFKNIKNSVDGFRFSKFKIDHNFDEK